MAFTVYITHPHSAAIAGVYKDGIPIIIII